MKGGGTLVEACSKWRSPSTRQQPENTRVEIEEAESYKTVYETLASVPKDHFLILKLGSNDNTVVKHDSGAIELNGKLYVRGSKGETGTLFFEMESKGEAGKTASSGIVNLSKTNLKGVERYARSAVRRLNNAIENNPEKKHLIAITPEKKYDGFSYPFIKRNDESQDFSYILPHLLGGDIPDENRTYIQAVFPIGINNDEESYNYKILNMLVERPGPLLIFNAMGSTCYRSIKYILDKRTYLKNPEIPKLTLYGGLVDVLEGSSCSFGVEIYPDPEERCKEKTGGKRSHTRTRKRITRKHKKRTYKK
jgi:hypothetical protein